MDAGAFIVNQYCIVDYNKDTDEFHVSHTDVAGTKVVSSSTVTFAKAENIIGYTWQCENRETGDDDITLYQAFLEEHSEVTDFWHMN